MIPETLTLCPSEMCSSGRFLDVKCLKTRSYLLGRGAAWTWLWNVNTRWLVVLHGTQDQYRHTAPIAFPQEPAVDAEDVHFPAASDKLLLPSAWWFEGQKCKYRGQSIYLPRLGFSGCNCTEQIWSQTDIWCQSEAWHLSLSYGCREAWLHSGFFTGNVTANHHKEPLVLC